ncbi:THUMP domain-containing class I SAM-dependent RNA methyltransferase [Chachezhania sediminis]|uniref:THUMP domain-containing class I SAM-dependent RNA methyltransferase n=1 Tax=Chachezhania sediminis TaxID=2599291 RepID=UPI00131C4F05|nr:class I SAM-dependent RNA methyltransferase [Chachezhania sediminis]
MEQEFEIFLVAAPGLEDMLQAEARALGFAGPAVVPGGVVTSGGWPEVWRANLMLRGATRVLVRFASFRAMHLAQLDKRARKVDWASVLRADVPVRVEATCHASRIYHAGAAAQRITRAIAETLGAPVIEGPKTKPKGPKNGDDDDDAPALATGPAPVRVMARIDDDLCTLSLDASGEGLHKRGHKPAVGKAPMRETLAALFLAQCGYTGTEPVLDPMCGSGTFVIEAAEIALGLAPGRSRGFAFERLAGFDPAAWDAMRAAVRPRALPEGLRFHGSDRDAGAVKMSIANAERAGVDAVTEFRNAAFSDIAAPGGPPGLVMVNPPYGTRIGNRKLLFGLHGALGEVLRTRFKGWRVGIVTSDGGLAKSTGLPFLPPGPPVPHGGLKVKLYRTDPLR